MELSNRCNHSTYSIHETMKRFCLVGSMVLLGTIVLRGAVINVSPGTGTLKTAVGNAVAGDELVLEDGIYAESSLKPTAALTIKAAQGAHPIISLSSRFEIKADFTIEGVELQSTGEAVRMLPGSVHSVAAPPISSGHILLRKKIPIYMPSQWKIVPSVWEVKRPILHAE